VDRTEWLWTPQTNNAYNGGARLDVVFPAGFLHAPNFDANADAAINYGAIGATIGHELTHGFDSQGRKIDSTGALRDWWTKDDASGFEARSKQLGDQFSLYEPLPGLRVKGDQTMTENVADLGGLAIALDAYHASLGGKQAPMVGGLTGDQRVLLGYAQSWREKRTEKALRKQVANNEHAPSQFRVDGVVRNIDIWYEAFAVKPSDKFYLAPRARVRIW
jgi:putative endopeptidase